VRNYNDGWADLADGIRQQIGQVEDCAAIEFEWKGDRLKTRFCRRCCQTPSNRGNGLFNHATFFHVSTLEPTMREALLAEFKEEDLPTTPTMAMAPIEPSVLDEL